MTTFNIYKTLVSIIKRYVLLNAFKARLNYCYVHMFIILWCYKYVTPDIECDSNTECINNYLTHIVSYLDASFLLGIEYYCYIYLMITMDILNLKHDSIQQHIFTFLNNFELNCTFTARPLGLSPSIISLDLRKLSKNSLDN